MVEITDTAVEKAIEVLQAEGKTGWGLKVFSSGSSCCGPSFGMDILESPDEDDKVIEKGALKVFASDSTLEGLKGLIIDFVDDGQQKGFVIRSNAESTDGCGCASGTCG